ncbi:peptidoglycan-binding domain-containing protein [Sphingomonas endolithica]|uniref:peptidoglycan recognition protein family protein n=1 Tax=Sphingomonas endolithica TaxID=2972485 RepID=UPI0021AF66BB|nr:peptidoglycan-binding domain-containing protein [Sphingomonas sp. ZFBP2030]
MTGRLLWLADTLRDAGLKVAEAVDWRTRGKPTVGPIGVMCHHTATATAGNMPTLRLLIEGRAAGPGAGALPGPLAQLGLGRDGTFYVIASGRANHAGKGEWQGVTDGNGSFIGIEAEHSGKPHDDWPPEQRVAYVRGSAALLRHIKAPAIMCCGHLEYALPRGRKSDPCFDMTDFRHAVATALEEDTPAPLIPVQDGAGRPTLRRGSRGEKVEEIQALLSLARDGDFGPVTEATLRAFQRRAGIVPDGIAGPRTWQALLSVTPIG